MLPAAIGEERMTSRKNSWTAARWLAVLLLIWTLAGIAAFLMQWTQDLDQLARTDPYQARAFKTMPGWAWAAYAVAVLTGLIGALLLVVRRKGAVLFSGIEVVAVMLQFGYTLLLTDLLAVKGASAAAFPAVIFILSLVQLGLALGMSRAGQLG
jgi:hypothetical protein